MYLESEQQEGAEVSTRTKVYCRVRPLIGSDVPSNTFRVKPDFRNLPTCVYLESDHRTISIQSELFDRKQFKIDGTFSSYATQEEVYLQIQGKSTIEKHFMEQGFNCSILCYGQSGSGKTYTMFNDSPGNETEVGFDGIVFRVLFDIFSFRKDETLEMSMVQLYNEKLYNMLSSEEHHKDLPMRETPEGNQIVGLEQAQLVGLEQAIALITIALKKRQRRSTQCNNSSSRSHVIITIYYNGKRRRSALYLVDLAGSEQPYASKTKFNTINGPMTKTKRESISINRSILCLGQCVQALCLSQKHIPYRNSKLTRILSEALGGNSRCIIICTIVSTTAQMQETISTLKFAQRAVKVKRTLSPTKYSLLRIPKNENAIDDVSENEKESVFAYMFDEDSLYDDSVKEFPEYDAEREEEENHHHVEEEDQHILSKCMNGKIAPVIFTEMLEERTRQLQEALHGSNETRKTIREQKDALSKKLSMALKKLDNCR
jgi:hypothetical protein